MNRVQLLSLLNNSGLTQNLGQVLQGLVFGVTKTLKNAMPEFDAPELTAKDQDRQLLNEVGPAAAYSAMEFAVSTCLSQGKFSTLPGLNGHPVHNTKLIFNAPMEEYQSFSNVMRQYLLPRYAYLDFDSVVDPRHRIDHECGYPKFITPIMYRYMYDRDDMARRVVDIYPDESWASSPEVYENPKEDEPDTPFEEDWKMLCEDYNILQYLYRMDRLAGIGHYGALLLGIADGEDLEKPVDAPELLAGMRKTVSRKSRQLLYMRPFDEYLSFIHQYETDVMHPRYGLPKFYNLVFLDMTIDAAGASIGTRLNRRVHWTRVVHVADNLQSSLVFGIPRQQSVFNRLLDLRKIKGGSAEMFWKGAFPGISFEIDPRFVQDDPDFDKDKFRQEISDYADGLQRYLTLVGIKANSLAPQIADPERHVKIQMQAIAAHFGVPLRIFLGSEEGRLASSQDKLTWNRRLGRRLKTFVEPSLIRNVIDRFIALGIMRPPKNNKYFVDWGDLNTVADEDKANLALKWTQALSQYVSSGTIHLIAPMDYMTLILGIKPADAIRVIAQVKSQGGWEKLLKVDPSQQPNPGANGTQKNNVSKGDRKGTAASRPAKKTKPKKSSD